MADTLIAATPRATSASSSSVGVVFYRCSGAIQFSPLVPILACFVLVIHIARSGTVASDLIVEHDHVRLWRHFGIMAMGQHARDAD